jgi:phosphoenolpyruvate carboxykinase (ATP)
MSSISTPQPRLDLATAKNVYRNLSVPELIEHAIRNGEARLSANGALVSETGKYTGRTPKDKCVVREPSTEADIWWENNADLSEEAFERLYSKATATLPQKSLYVVDTIAGADPEYQVRCRFVVEKAWHALFIRQLLIRPTKEQLASFEPDWTILDLSTESCDPKVDGTRGDALIALNFAARKVLILGTQYAGEMKKSVFTIMNLLLPKRGVLSMHCSANIGADGTVALFFGLSGTGKTTLSADPSRRLIGDDEHGWSDRGVFNIEGGCYAKCIKLSHEGEPQIWNAIRFGSVLENVVLREDRSPDFDDASITENTRCAYPVDFIDGAVIPSMGGHPAHIFFLTCDAFGVLPPISKLDAEQAMYHFLNGYTAKVAGTEAGVTEPSATFSTCFGAPFLPLRPKVYADMLGEKIALHGSQVWLVNTGWSGGPFGVGSRIKLVYTRAMLRAALDGALDSVPTHVDPIFGLAVPTSCPGVPAEILLPRNTWSDGAAYDAKARELFAMFEANFKRFD